MYLFGIVEPPKGNLDPIPIQQLSSNRIKNIENIINKESYVDKSHISSIEVTNDSGIVVLTVLGKKINEEPFNLLK